MCAKPFFYRSGTCPRVQPLFFLIFLFDVSSIPNTFKKFHHFYLKITFCYCFLKNEVCFCYVSPARLFYLFFFLKNYYLIKKECHEFIILFVSIFSSCRIIE
jgi:hypothetical protein